MRHLCSAMFLTAALAGNALCADNAPASASSQPAPAAERPPLAPPRSVYDQAFDETFKQATEGWMEDPLRHIEGDMSSAFDLLAAMKTDKPVQKSQDQAVKRLNAVIAMLEQQCKNGAGGDANPTKPLANSIIAKGPGGQGDMHDPKQGEKQWASLPAKQREQILQSKTEGFPPGFEAVLQSYYERLAQEQLDDPGAAAPAAPAAGPAPAAPQGAK